MDNRTDEEILLELNLRNITKYGAVIAYSVVLITVGIFGNVLLFVFYRFNSRRTTTNILITWLAATDLVTNIVFIDEIIRLCFTVNFTNYIGCCLISFFNHSMVTISTCLFVIISVDRYRKICRPFGWQLTMTKIKVLIFCVIIFAVITSLRDFARLDIMAINITDPDTGRQIVAYYCTHTRDTDLKIFVVVSTCFDLFAFFTTSISSAVLYTIIVCNLWKLRQIKRQRNTAGLHIAMKRNSTTTFESQTKSIENISNGEQGVVEAMLNGTKGQKKAELTVEVKHDKDTDYASDCSVEAETKLTDGEICNSSIDAKATSSGVENGKRNKIKNLIFPWRTEQSYKVERNVTFMMIAISVSAILSFVPYFIVNVAFQLSLNTPDQDIDVGIHIALRSFLLYSASRPYIIGLFNTEFRRFVKNLLLRVLSCGCTLKQICLRR